MPRQTRRKRRNFGTCEEKIIKGRKYLYYSFPTPVWAFSKWPELHLGARQWHCVLPEDELEGDAWLVSARKAVRDETWIPDKLKKAKERKKTITFRQYAVPWVENRRKIDGTPLKETAKQKYRESLDLYLLDYFGNKPLQAISPRDVQKWWDDFKPVRLDTDLEDRRYHVYKHLKTILQSAATEPITATGETLIDRDPCLIKAARPMVKHDVVRPTANQLRAFLNELPDWARLVALICDDAGLRESEALGLCREHIDFTRMKIKVRQQVQRIRNGKGEYVTAITALKTRTSIRDVAMTTSLANELAAWMKTKHITGQKAMLFKSPRTGEILYGQNYRNAFADARRKVPGLEHMRPHDLRKDALSRLSESGATIGEIMKQAGHASIAVASTYQTPSTQHMDGVMKRMDEYDRQRNTTDDANQRSLKDLADLASDMPLEKRIRLLDALTTDDRVHVLELLQGDIKIETMTRLLSSPNQR